MSPVGPGRHLRHGLILAGGVVGVLASPAVQRLRDEVRLRAARAAAGADPVGPFREAPCYSRNPEATSGPAQSRTRAVP